MNSCFENQKIKKRKRILLLYQILLCLFILIMWEVCTYFKIIDSFLVSSPSRIIKCLIKYFNEGLIWKHIGISMLEVVLGIVIGSLIGIFIASVLWLNKWLEEILDPFLAVLNALPKTALAPIMIIWAGTGVKGIVVVSLSLLLIITIISTYNFFKNIEVEKIKMLKSFNATKYQIFFKLVLPYNFVNIISVIKINVGMAWIGVIVGEFLVSKAGLGYLIMYGGQVFDLDLVMMGVIVLAVLAFAMWKCVDLFEKHMLKKR